ncbi:hypothetical protein Vretifemale_20811, partial [Volvox reticuliferus]
MQLFARACCFGRSFENTASEKFNNERTHNVIDCGADGHAAAQVKDRRAASAQIDAPWRLHLGNPLPSSIADSDCPVAVISLNDWAVLHDCDDIALTEFLECVLINDAVHHVLGPATPQAYQRLILLALLEKEPNFLLELRETLHSLQEQECHTPLLAVAGGTTVSNKDWKSIKCRQPSAPVIPDRPGSKTQRKMTVTVPRRKDAWGGSVSFEDSGKDGNGGAATRETPAPDACSVQLNFEGLRLHPCWLFDEV